MSGCGFPEHEGKEKETLSQLWRASFSQVDSVFILPQANPQFALRPGLRPDRHINRGRDRAFPELDEVNLPEALVLRLQATGRYWIRISGNQNENFMAIIWSSEIRAW